MREQCQRCCPPALGVADRTCRDWLKTLGEDDTSIEDRPRSRRPLQSDIERIKALIEDNPLLTTHA